MNNERTHFSSQTLKPTQSIVSKKALRRILAFFFLLMSFSAFGQKEASWQMFGMDSIQSGPNMFGVECQEYSVFMNLESDSSHFTLSEYFVIRNKKGKYVYARSMYRGRFKSEDDSTFLSLEPNEVTFLTRSDGQEIEEVKQVSQYFKWRLFLDPDRLVLFDVSAESLFRKNAFHMEMRLLGEIEPQELEEFDASFKKWGYGSFDAPLADSSLSLDSNRYFLEITNLTAEETMKIDSCLYQQYLEGADVLLFEPVHEKVDRLKMVSVESASHELVHKYYLYLKKGGYAVKMKKSPKTQ